MVTSEEFTGWKNHPVTKWVMESLKIEREKLKEELASMSLADAGTLAMKHAEYVGMCAALLDVLTLEHQGISGVYNLDREVENDD